VATGEGFSQMAIFVPVHGAWGGSYGFRKIRGPLRAAGSLEHIGDRGV